MAEKQGKKKTEENKNNETSVQETKEKTPTKKTTNQKKETKEQEVVKEETTEKKETVGKDNVQKEETAEKKETKEQEVVKEETAEKKETEEQEVVKEETTEKKETVGKDNVQKEETTEKKETVGKDNVQKEETTEKKDTVEEDKKQASKKVAKVSEKSKVKREEAIVNGSSLPLSTKDAAAVCRFIRYKKIDKAIEELEEVVKMKRSIPTKGEIPHRKGPGKRASGSGRFPIKTCINFIKLLGSLKANSENNGLENPVVAIAYANIATRPAGRFGRTRKKRSHIKIIAKNKNKLRNEKNKLLIKNK